jgi:hypothetical protein
MYYLYNWEALASIIYHIVLFISFHIVFNDVHVVK